MPVPETTVHENHFLTAGKNDIRSAGQPFAMQPIPITVRPKPLSDKQFRFRILSFDQRHASAAFGGCEGIDHIPILCLCPLLWNPYAGKIAAPRITHLFTKNVIYERR